MAGAPHHRCRSLGFLSPIWAGHFALTVLVSTHEYKYTVGVRELIGQLHIIPRAISDKSASHSGEVAILCFMLQKPALKLSSNEPSP